MQCDSTTERNEVPEGIYFFLIGKYKKLTGLEKFPVKDPSIFYRNCFACIEVCAGCVYEYMEKYSSMP